KKTALSERGNTIKILIEKRFVIINIFIYTVDNKGYGEDPHSRDIRLEERKYTIDSVPIFIF
ncbi:hypothetical protein UB39_22140, partial [Photobacterium angustum]